MGSVAIERAVVDRERAFVGDAAAGVGAVVLGERAVVDRERAHVEDAAADALEDPIVIEHAVVDREFARVVDAAATLTGDVPSEGAAVNSE